MASERVRTLLIAIVGLVVGAVLGDQYIGRLPNHRGFWLVRVEDRVDVVTERPRRTVVIVVDGLRRDSAETMASVKRLAAKGQCRQSDQGSYTVSRPVYALLSTGLEVNRTGARNNDLTAPLDVESVWEVARRAGLRVRGSSHLPWFKQLFPRGFDEFRHYEGSHDANVFAPDGARFDIELFHPLYVDEKGHKHGGASPEYAAAVARADNEITGLLDALDLEHDLVVFTADHGHRDEGGHGGSQPEIRYVLACFAGPNVQHREGRGAFDGRVTAPLLSVLLGLPFPANMRAGEDGLDVIWEIARVEDGYARDRRAAIAKFRRENADALERWLGGPPATWERLYERERHKQEGRGIIIAIAAAALFGLRLRRAARPMQHALWVVATFGLLWAAHRVVLGPFDYTVINLKEQFVPRAFLVVVLASAAAIALHRELASLAASFTTLVLLLLVANLGHIFVYGWPLGFPLPPDPARYWPFFGAIAQVGFALVTAVLVGVEKLRR